jgi:hypothetical protein
MTTAEDDEFRKKQKEGTKVTKNYYTYEYCGPSAQIRSFFAFFIRKSICNVRLCIRIMHIVTHEADHAAKVANG